MGESIERLGAMEELFGRDRLAEALRGKVREMIMTLAEAELAEVLAARSYERSPARRGYRNGKRRRSLSTGLGATVIELPRARITEGEREREWQSGLIARYQRLCYHFAGSFKNHCAAASCSALKTTSPSTLPTRLLPEVLGAVIIHRRID
jgi:Transposase, Mutator family